MLQSKADVCCVESDGVLLESSDLREIEKELTAWAVFENEKELGLALECEIHLDDEWMFDIFKNSSFGHGMLDLISPDNLSLLEFLDGVQFLSVLFLDEGHLTV